MNISKFTQKSVQAVQDLEKVAYQFGNQEIEEEHLLYALLEQEDSLILKLIEKMEIDKDYFRNSLNQALDARVKVSGGELRFGQYLNKALVSAEDEAKAMGDEYVSVEHLFLALLRYPSPSMKKLFQEFGITKERFLQALSTVRGHQRVVSDNPEATYDTLNKYGEDLVEKAREQKLDPVIGRDEEIRPRLEKPEWNELSDAIAAYAKAHHTHPALYNGGYANLLVRDKQLIFERSCDEERVIVAINADSNTFHADFNARSGLGTDLVTGETVDFGGGMDLPPYSAAYWKTEVI